jgi:hypothetical protein
MAKKTKSAKRGGPRERRERRFEPRSSTNPMVVYAVGAVGAVAMGAGTWGHFGPLLREGGPESFAYAPYVLAAGALLVGIAIWVGTTSDPTLRVGDGGIAVERGGVRRMPWYAIERITWRDEAIRATGKDEAGENMTVVASNAKQPQAAAWILKEARARVPAIVDVPDGATIPEVQTDAGETLPLEPAQVVGKRCAASDKIIAYEPDARVCPRCERVYHREHVPDECECGASLAELRSESKTA